MSSLDTLVGDSSGMRALRAAMERLLRLPRARRAPPVLILGETGTGKGLVARLLHGAGPRRHGPLVEVNCAAIPHALVEGELFGFERGAFTDAREAKPGLFQAAHGGVLLLDEVALLPGAAQGKLLTALDGGVVRRLGSTRAEAVDTWVIAASNEDLEAAVRSGRFREDLYHRLAVLTLAVPALRDRGADILVLAERFLARACRDHDLGPRTLSEDARRALARHRWPGNVRELANAMERVALQDEAPVVTAAALALPGWQRDEAGEDAAAADEPRLDETVARLERERVLAALERANGNVARAAHILGITRNRLRYRVERFGLATGRSALGRRVSRRAGAAPVDRPGPRPAAGRRPARWEPRHLALLRVGLPPAAAPDLACPAAGAFLSAVADTIRAFGGRVEEAGAREVIGAFGLEPAEDAAARAALAGLAAQRLVGDRRESAAGPGPPGAAVHAGCLPVGQLDGRPSIAMDDKRAACAVLDALAPLAEGQVVVSAAAAPFLERRFELARIEAPPVAGGPAFRVLGRERTGFGLAGRPLTPLAGRARDLALVEDLGARAEAGRGQVVAVVGEPGVGKTRFVYEVTRSARLRHFAVLQCGAVSFGSATPLLPVRDLLRRHFGVEDADSPAPARDKVRALLRSTDPALEAELTALASALEIPVDDPEWERLDPALRRRRSLDAVKQLVLAASRQRPVLLVVEDVQWLDTQTGALLDRLVDGVPTARVMLLVTHRPDHPSAWTDRSYCTALRLDPLPPTDAGAMLRALLGGDPALGAVARALLEQTEGNPLFIEESVRSLADTGALLGRPGAYRAGTARAGARVPPTVEAVLAARIDRLPPADRALLQAAAVLGVEAPRALLRAVAELPDRALAESLARLHERELLYQHGPAPGAKHVFKHALAQAVAYASLPAARRRVLHAGALRALASLPAARPDEHVEELARHALHAGDWEQAVTHGRAAGRKAYARGSYREAALHLEQALDALGRLPSGPARAEQHVDLLFELRLALLQVGDLLRGLDCLRQAEPIAAELDDARRLAWISVYAAGHRMLLGELAPAWEAGQRALSMAAGLADVGLTVSANTYAGQVCYVRGDYRQAAGLFRKNLEILVGDRVPERFGLPQPPAIHSRTNLVWCLAELGAFAEGVERGGEAVAIAEALGQPLGLVVACAGLGVLQLRQGTLPEAIRTLERGLGISRTRDIPLWFPTIASALGAAYTSIGRVAEARALLEEGEAATAALRMAQGHSLVLAGLAEAYLAAGRGPEAAAAAGRALELARRHLERGVEARVHLLLAEIAITAGADAEAGMAGCRRARALAGELGMRPLVAGTHLTGARAWRLAGDCRAAERDLDTAAALFRDLDMPWWLDRAVEARAALR